jgi:hypothetical protein
MRLALFFVVAVCCGAAIIDQLAVTVGNQAITENEVTDDIRLAALLNGVAVDNSVTARRAAAARLIEQALIRREMSFGSYPQVQESEVNEAMAAAEKAHGGRAALDESLKSYELTTKELRNYLTWQLQLLRFIDLRFRPAVQVTNEDIEKYYQESVVGPQPAGKAPELSEVRSQIEQKLSSERVDQQLDRWIRQSRARTTIRFEDAALSSEASLFPQPGTKK